MLTIPYTSPPTMPAADYDGECDLRERGRRARGRGWWRIAFRCKLIALRVTGNIRGSMRMIPPGCWYEPRPLSIAPDMPPAHCAVVVGPSTLAGRAWKTCLAASIVSGQSLLTHSSALIPRITAEETLVPDRTQASSSLRPCNTLPSLESTITGLPAR